MNVLTPCLKCGELSEHAHCPEHSALADSPTRPTYRERGYTAAWDRLSKRARKAQPFCTDCQATTNLTTDHKPIAWHRQEHGLAIRLQDVLVLCAPCNTKRGSSRPGTPRHEEWLATLDGENPRENAKAMTGGARGDNRHPEPASGRPTTPAGHQR